MGIMFGSADEIVLLIRRSLVRAQVEEPLKKSIDLLSAFFFSRQFSVADAAQGSTFDP